MLTATLSTTRTTAILQRFSERDSCCASSAMLNRQFIYADIGMPILTGWWYMNERGTHAPPQTHTRCVCKLCKDVYVRKERRGKSDFRLKALRTLASLAHKSAIHCHANRVKSTTVVVAKSWFINAVLCHHHSMGMGVSPCVVVFVGLPVICKLCIQVCRPYVYNCMRMTCMCIMLICTHVFIM